MSIERAKMLDNRDLREFVGHQKQMRKHGSVLTVQPMENLDWQFNLNPTRYVTKCSGRNQRLVQGGELSRAEDCRLRHKIFPEQIGVLDHGALERLENDAAFL